MGKAMLVKSCLLVVLGTTATAAWPAKVTIVTPTDASKLETLAAREVMRYVYLRTGALMSIAPREKAPAGEAIIVARKDRPVVARAVQRASARAAVAALGTQQYLLMTLARPRAPKTVLVVGGDDVGTLYGAYRLAEHLGVRFYLHGDVIPDARIGPDLPDLNETGRPLFSIRGIQPFHDFAEGPDWWTKDDYLAHVSQLAKMRMNFIGLHCYPEGGVGPEPAVWIGQADDCDESGRVAFSYPSQWASTSRDGMWGYAAMKTSAFCGGAAMLFESDEHGPEVMRGMMPSPTTPEQSNRLFNDVGEMFRAVFAQARALGVKTCVGTETPLTIPRAVQERLRAKGKDPGEPAVVREVYEGVFRRIAKAYLVDYYWLWTPEGWTWGGNKAEQLEATVRDLQSALAALEAIGNPFTLATCGWVLGPQQDRAALDEVLPKSCPMSCINRQVGHAPVEPSFARVSGRPKWAIPWMENDPNLVAPQPWVGRMRYDAADALRLGCTGLLGIHWRTKAMAPNVAALAAAGWDQSWVPATFDAEPVTPEPDAAVGALGGNVARFTAPVADTDEDPVYQSVRYNLDGYNLEIPNGTYAVTLKFNEPHYGEKGKRVFGATLQGRQVIDRLDVFARVGKNRALDFTFPNVRVVDGLLRIGFLRETEFPCIAGIVIEGTTEAADEVAAAPFARRINCGGPAYREYEGDPDPQSSGVPGKDRTMPVEDFYIDFARASFGRSVAEEAGRILASVDGVNMPEPSGWIGGPGGVKVEKAPWAQVRARYGFVDELARLRRRVEGAGNLERFDYWLNTYRCMAAMAEAGCLRGQLDQTMAAIKVQEDPAKKTDLAQQALAFRVALARTWERMVSLQVAATDTAGEMGTVANLEQHTRKRLNFLGAHDAELAAALGSPLPDTCQPSEAYTGPARIIVPTVRTLIEPGESLTLKVIIIAPGGEQRKPTPATGHVLWRPMGRGAFSKMPLTHVARGVYRAELPPMPAGTEAFEYYIEANHEATRLVYPATAPAMNQTVVVSSIAEE